MANHPYELPASTGNWLHIDMGITGLGGNSCGQGGPLEYDRVKAGPHTFGFIIQPTKVRKPEAKVLRQAFSGMTPLQITRDAEGAVSISSAKKERGISENIWYKVIPANATAKQLKALKPQHYTGPFVQREACKVVAYEKKYESKVEFTQEFKKLDKIPVSVYFASSVESGEGDADHLVDGNPNTYWHTMWSVTVANYPHWVDFDCGSTKMLKGFTYLPRQDSRNGNIKNYRVQLSMDGKTWGDAVIEGQFENNQREKTVYFSRPQRARYLRFTALSSQDGQDFATGAEFAVLEE